MRRALLIFLSLVLVLVGWSTVGAEDGFYVIQGMRKNYAPVPKTGQLTSTTSLTGTDAALQKGVAWPDPRLIDNGDHTVTDKLTGLIWTKNANYFETLTWEAALAAAANLCDPRTDGKPLWWGCLTDHSRKGDWRLPNVRELYSLVDYRYAGGPSPPLPSPYPFTNVVMATYWSSTATASYASYAHTLNFGDYMSVHYSPVSTPNYVWCVRGGP